MFSQNGIDARRPYAPAANIVAIFRRARSRNLPDVLDDDFYRLVGISDAVLGRVRETVRFIGLVDEDGSPTDTLRAIAAAPDDEYRRLLADTIRDAYTQDFTRIDPAEDSQEQIQDAFRRYQPRSQTARMVMLFLGLCREAGIAVLDVPRERKQQSSGSKRVQKRGTGVGRKSAKPERQDRQEPLVPGTLFGVTEEDVAALSEEEFASLWTALGTVARKRGQARQKAKDVGSEDSAAQESRQEEAGT